MVGQYLGNNCYCYNEECNQKKWEELGKEGKRKWTVVSGFVFKGQKAPKCPYCKKKMTVTDNFYEDC
jgi:hypothetical protein